MRSLQTELPLARERNSGSAVRLPVRTTRLMLVAAIGVAPFLPSLRPRSLGGRVYVRARSDPRNGRKLGGFLDRVVADRRCAVASARSRSAAPPRRRPWPPTRD